MLKSQPNPCYLLKTCASTKLVGAHLSGWKRNSPIRHWTISTCQGADERPRLVLLNSNLPAQLLFTFISKTSFFPLGSFLLSSFNCREIKKNTRKYKMKKMNLKMKWKITARKIKNWNCKIKGKKEWRIFIFTVWFIEKWMALIFKLSRFIVQRRRY